MENLVKMTCFENIYQGKKVLVTGNTGFKGSWLAEWLCLLGAEVTGLSLAESDNQTHFKGLSPSYPTYFSDIRNLDPTQEILDKVKPDIVFHLAAQALVIDSYTSPIETYQTNVMGTLHVLEASRLSGVKAVVVVTSDKCYENKEWVWGYRENDPMGGHDMYSSSKGCAEILAQSYRKSFCQLPNAMKIATARAGNVIGGGDFSKNRIVPDLIQSVVLNRPSEVRNPKATRPWQHVLEPLSGYLLLGMHMLLDKNVSEGWNFGPSTESNCSVEDLVNLALEAWPALEVAYRSKPEGLHEAHLLMLDCSKASKYLSWSPVWNLKQTVSYTMDWYRQWNKDNHMPTREQIDLYCAEAKRKRAVWTS